MYIYSLKKKKANIKTNFRTNDFWSSLQRFPKCGLKKIPISYPPFIQSKSESCSVISDCLWSQFMEFSRPEYWSGYPFPSPGDLPNPGIKPSSQHCEWILYQLSHKGSPRILEYIAYPFSSRSSQSRNRTGVSCIAGGFFHQLTLKLPMFQVRSIHQIATKAPSQYETLTLSYKDIIFLILNLPPC